MANYVLGIDPGVVSGWALVGGQPARPIILGQAGARNRRCEPLEMAGVVRRCLEEISPQSRLSVAVEGQFVLAGGGKGDVNHGKTLSVLKMARVAGQWEGVALALGCDLFCKDGIQPQTWRSAVWGGRWTTEQAKMHAVKMAEHTFGIHIPKTHHHTAEAVWIGLYALESLLEMAECLKDGNEHSTNLPESYCADDVGKECFRGLLHHVAKNT